MQEADELFVDYLIHACVFSEFNCAAMSDADFEALSDLVLELWDKITHRHKILVHHESLLRSSSGHYIKFPQIVRSCAARTACKTPGSKLYTETLIRGQEKTLYRWRHMDMVATLTRE